MASETVLSRTAFVAGAASLAATATARAADLTTLTVGITPGDPASVVYYAQQLGYFKNAGLDVRISIMNSGPVIATAVTGGSLDIGAVNVGSLASARLRGVPLRIMAPAAIVPPGRVGDVVMVRNDSPIRNGSDFNNKTVGIVAIKTVQQAAVMAWIDARGGDSRAVRFIEIPLPEMVGALDSGRFDAAIPVEPFTSQGLANNRVLGTGVYDALPRPFLVFAFASTDSWLARNAPIATKFADAIVRAAAWANTHDRERRQMLIGLMKVDPQTANRMLLWPMATTLNPVLIRPVIDVMVKYGILERPIVPAEMLWRSA